MSCGLLLWFFFRISTILPKAAWNLRKYSFVIITYRELLWISISNIISAPHSFKSTPYKYNLNSVIIKSKIREIPPLYKEAFFADPLLVFYTLIQYTCWFTKSNKTTFKQITCKRISCSWISFRILLYIDEHRVHLEIYSTCPNHIADHPVSIRITITSVFDRIFE